MNTFNPIKSIRSRYINTYISSQYYGTINISGSTLLYPSAVGITGSTNLGYIWAPYITVCDDKDYQRIKLLEDRKQKLENLAKIT